MTIPYNKLPHKTKAAINFVKNYFDNPEFVFLEDHKGKFICFLGENYKGEFKFNTIEIWMRIIKYYNLMTPEIQNELFPFIFGGE